MTIEEILKAGATAFATYTATQNTQQNAANTSVTPVKDNASKLLLIVGVSVVVLTIIFFSIRKK
jgi:hypothetical protein